MTRPLANTAACRTGLAFLFLTALVAATGRAQDTEEYAALAGNEQRLRAKIEHLKQQQRFLQFEKSLYASDSKYVVMDVSAGKGTLNYRNRILKSFEFSLKPSSRGRVPKQGPLLLSGKKEGKPRERQLVFGDQVVVLRSSKSGAAAGKRWQTPEAIIGTKDFASLFYALEKGSYLYILRESDK